MGVGLTGRAIFVDETLDARKYGLPQNFVIIENVDEWQNCIDCNTGKIVSWDQSGYIKEENNFPQKTSYLILSVGSFFIGYIHVI